MRILILLALSAFSVFGQCKPMPDPLHPGEMTCKPGLQPDKNGNYSIGATVLPGTAIATTSATTVNLVAGNNGQQISFTAGTDVTLNITSAVAVQGFSILIIQRGAGAVIPTASGAGITIRQRESKTKTAGQYAMATLSCDIAGDCILGGDLQ